MTKSTDKQWFRPDEVAEYMSVDRRTIYRWIQEDRLKAVKVKRMIRIHRDSIGIMEREYEIQ